MQFYQTKSILTKVKDGTRWFGHDYNMNLYRGCCHGCIYCDSRSSCYHVDNFDTVRGKQDGLLILNKELATKKQKGVIGMGAMSDSYNPYERKYQITRSALELICRYRFGISLATKSDLVIRDIDVLSEINKKIMF